VTLKSQSGSDKDSFVQATPLSLASCGAGTPLNARHIGNIDRSALLGITREPRAIHCCQCALISGWLAVFCLSHGMTLRLRVPVRDR